MLENEVMDVLFYYYIGFWIVLATMGRDGDPVGVIDVGVCVLYPVMYAIIIPYCIIRDECEGS